MKAFLKFTALSAVLLMLAGGLASCNDREEPFLTVDQTPISVVAEGGVYQIAVNSNGAWAAAVEDAENHTWLTLTDASGTNDGTIIVNISENVLFTGRQAVVEITLGSLAKSVTIYQEAAERLIEIPSELTITFTRFVLKSPAPPILGTSCHLVNLVHDTWNPRLVIINSDEELMNYIYCPNGDFLDFDFSRYTLLLAEGHHNVDVISMKVALFRNITNKYTLIVSIDSGFLGATDPWATLLLVPKLPEQAEILLKIEGKPWLLH